VFAEDASVVELARSNYSSTYSVLAQSAGHEHRYLECEPRGVDLVVDPAALESALADALAAKRVEK
jgi:hypothetical protein